jgi:hypothetical protein
LDFLKISTFFCYFNLKFKKITLKIYKKLLSNMNKMLIFNVNFKNSGNLSYIKYILKIENYSEYSVFVP